MLPHAVQAAGQVRCRSECVLFAGGHFHACFLECLIRASFLGKDGAGMVHPAPRFRCLSPLWIQMAAKRKKTLLQLGSE